MSDEKQKASSKKRGTSAGRETQKPTQAANRESADMMNEEQKHKRDQDDSKPAARDVNDDNDSAAAAQDDGNQIVASNRKRIWLKRKPNMSEAELKKEKREANRLSAYHSRRRKNDIIDNLKATVEDTDKDTQKLMDEHQRLQSELTDLKANNQSLNSENEALRNELSSLDTPNPWARSLSNVNTDSQDAAEPPQSRRSFFGQRPAQRNVEPSQEHAMSRGDQLETDRVVPDVISSSDDRVTDVPHAAFLLALLENQQQVYSRRGSTSTTTSDTSSAISHEEVVQLQELLLQLQQQEEEQQQQLQQASTRLISVQSSISFLPPRSTEASSSIPGTSTPPTGTIVPPSVPSQQLASDLAAQQTLSPGEMVRLLQIFSKMDCIPTRWPLAVKKATKKRMNRRGSHHRDFEASLTIGSFVKTKPRIDCSASA